MEILIPEASLFSKSHKHMSEGVRGVEDILISWFVIILALLGVVLLFVYCMIHCKHLR